MKRAMKREYDFSRGKRGPVISVPKGKTRTTIRLDDDVPDWFRQQADRAGGNYQTLINDALRQQIRRVQEPLEATLRRVIRAGPSVARRWPERQCPRTPKPHDSAALYPRRRAGRRGS